MGRWDDQLRFYISSTWPIILKLCARCNYVPWFITTALLSVNMDKYSERTLVVLYFSRYDNRQRVNNTYIFYPFEHNRLTSALLEFGSEALIAGRCLGGDILVGEDGEAKPPSKVLMPRTASHPLSVLESLMIVMIVLFWRRVGPFVGDVLSRRQTKSEARNEDEHGEGFK